MELKMKCRETPNPNARKYILNHDVKTEGKISYQERGECEHVPLAAALLDLANVTQVHLFENVITVTQNGASDWEVLDGAVRTVIEDRMRDHDPGFQEAEDRSVKQDKSQFTPDMVKIDEILERTVRPALQADGGDLEVLDLEGNILTIRYEGACGGCPSAMMGTLEAIKGILQNEFREDLEVVTV